ncbi:MAG: family 1 encapsulin nanocompartment shell protein [Solirubrobacteraceae bacterium]
MSTHLLRSHAPISDSNWKLLDDEARDRLSVALAARRLIDFAGPKGWDYSATNLGRIEHVAAAPCAGVTAVQRRVLPLVEVRADFAISRDELRDDDRGATDTDLAALDRAAHQIAVAENRAVFHGWAEASISGIAEASPHQGLQLGAEPSGYPRPVASAVEQLLRSGISGPYALALGSEEYKRVVETAENGGYPLLDHLRKIVEGELIWAPGVDGAVVVSMRGGDFQFESGQDLSIGYLSHDSDVVHFYLEESFSFHIATPEAAAPLKAADAAV